MIMKTIRQLLMMTFAVLVVAACSNDDVIPEEPGGGGESDMGAWVALRIKTPPKTRSYVGEENATAEESKVNTVRAIFFNGDADPKVVQDKLLLGTESGTPGPSGTAGGAFKVEEGAKYILIVANATSQFANSGNTWRTGTAFSEVNAALTTTVADVIGSGATPSNFMMTNAKGDLEPSYIATDQEVLDGTKKLGDLKTLTLYATKEKAEEAGNALDVYIDRVVAKVQLGLDGDLSTGTDDNDNAKVTFIKWTLNVTNKKFFPLSTRTKTWNEGAQAEGTYDPSAGGTWGGSTYPLGKPNGVDDYDHFTSNDRYYLGSYRVDPNYIDNPLTWEWGQTGYADNFNYYAGTADVTNWSDAAGIEYCHENSVGKDFNKHAYTTHVLVKAKYIPKGVLDVNGDEVTVAEDQDWIIIDNGIYTYESLLGFVRKELVLKFGNLATEPSTITTNITDDLNGYLASFETTKAVSIPVDWDAFKTRFNISGDPTEQEIAEGINELITEFEAVTDLEAKTVGNLNYYHAGENYYKIMIKHDNVDVRDENGNQYILNELGEFGVVRNSYYVITLNKIMNPGYPVIPDPDKDKDNEEDEGYISLRINVNPWMHYTQTEDL